MALSSYRLAATVCPRAKRRITVDDAISQRRSVRIGCLWAPLCRAAKVRVPQDLSPGPGICAARTRCDCGARRLEGEEKGMEKKKEKKGRKK